jgi:hypothetical protein
MPSRSRSRTRHGYAFVLKTDIMAANAINPEIPVFREGLSCIIGMIHEETDQA